MMNLKDFREEGRVEHLVPNQMLFPIEPYGIQNTWERLDDLGYAVTILKIQA